MVDLALMQHLRLSNLGVNIVYRNSLPLSFVLAATGTALDDLLAKGAHIRMVEVQIFTSLGLQACLSLLSFPCVL